tara:strand:- start:255 stop:374 length:120 start_codon:yes stop_codon:yes gene_type:complete
MGPAVLTPAPMGLEDQFQGLEKAGQDIPAVLALATVGGL